MWHKLAFSQKDIEEAIKDYPEIKEIRDNKGDTIWHILALLNDYEYLKKIIINHPNIKNLRNYDGQLIWCYMTNRNSVLKQAYKDFKFDINEIPLNFQWILKETEIEKLYEKYKNCINYSDIPADFICIISSELILDPVITTTGNHYDRHHITEWLKKSDIDPKSNTKLTNKILYPCNFLEKKIIEFLKSC